ncbi:MAG: hypothetical protein GY839_07475 [candidate division Zixibacteria bacterium]|nr:hypothetical protein [candidate division Zixibacteria bacterium]
MKKVTVLLMALAIVLISSSSTLAQETKGDKAIGGSVILAFPFGNLGDVAGTGFGLDGLFEYGWNKNITATGTIGFMKWGGKSVGTYDWNYSHYKLVGGIKYYFNPGKTGWFAGGDIGFHIYKYNWKWDSPFGGQTEQSASASDFSLSPLGGYEMPFGNSGMRWSFTGIMAWAGDTYLGVRVGVLFPMGQGQNTNSEN